MPRGKGKAGTAKTVGAPAQLQPVAPPNRGRIQVQGMDMSPELSQAWASTEPPTAQASAKELDVLRGKCTPTQLAHRQEAFPKALRYVESKAGRGVDAPVSKTFEDRARPRTAKDARVDIEVLYGRAFV